MTISDDINQMWKDRYDTNRISSLPQGHPEYKGYSESWKKHHSSHTLWSNKEIEELWKRKELERWSGFYRTLQYHIETCDFTRYAILYVYGGVYVDLDYICQKSIKPLLLDRDLLLCYEPPEHFQGGVRYISNSIMGSIPGHWFWAALMDDIMNDYANTITTPGTNALDTTGPRRIFYLVEKYLIRDICGNVSKGNWLTSKDFADTCDLIPLSKYGLSNICDKDGLSKAYSFTRWGEGTGWITEYIPKMICDYTHWFLIFLLLVLLICLYFMK